MSVVPKEPVFKCDFCGILSNDEAFKEPRPDYRFRYTPRLLILSSELHICCFCIHNGPKIRQSLFKVYMQLNERQEQYEEVARCVAKIAMYYAQDRCWDGPAAPILGGLFAIADGAGPREVKKALYL